MREGNEKKQKGRAIKHTLSESSHLRLIVWARFGAHATQSTPCKSGAKTQFANPTGRAYFPAISLILERPGFPGKHRGQAASRIGQALNSGRAGQGKPHREAESHWQRPCSRGLRFLLAAPVLEWALARASPSAHCVRSGHHILIGCDGAEGGMSLSRVQPRETHTLVPIPSKAECPSASCFFFW